MSKSALLGGRKRLQFFSERKWPAADLLVLPPEKMDLRKCGVR
jgi:hypothetical protein